MTASNTPSDDPAGLEPAADFGDPASDPDFDAESGSAGFEFSADMSAEMGVAQMHLELGGALELRRGVVAPAGYGDDAAEDEALRQGWTVRHRTGLDVLEMRGEDRLRFLNAQASCEVKDLAAGAGVFGFFAGAKGKVEADVQVLASEDRLWLVLPPGRGAVIAARLEKYKVVDRVEIAPLELTSLAVAGPLAGERLAALLDGQAELPSDELSHVEVEVHGVPVRIVREPSLSIDGGDEESVEIFTLWLEPKHLEKLLDRLLDQDRGPTLVGWRAWDQLRIEAGWPLFGLDYGEDAFPQETGHGARGVSYTKGCYLGQEVVARIHYRGGVQRRMCRLALSDRARSGRELHLGGRKVGMLGTVSRLPSGEWAALAIVHQKAETGARLDVVDAETGQEVDVTATVGEDVDRPE